MKRTRPTKTAAINAVKAAVVEMTEEITHKSINRSSKFRDVAEQWFAEVELQVREGRKSPTTASIYRGYLNRHVLPALGELRMRTEVNTVSCNALMTAKRRAGAKDDLLSGIRNVMSSVCSYAVRHGALESNPVRELERLQRSARPKVRALTAAERADILAKLAVDPVARTHELADVLTGMLATGVRVSELLGCCGDDVLLDEDAQPRLTVDHRTTRLKGQGIVRQARTGGAKGEGQTLLIPAWSVPMLRRRKLASGGSGPLFPNRFGEWRGRHSVTVPLREALDRIGYEWVTSHVMRKTVATVLKQAGLPVRKIADQLGQASTAITERHYLERDASNTDQVAALEDML